MSPFAARKDCYLAAAIALALVDLSAHAATITVNSADDDATSTFCNLRDAATSILNGGATPTCSNAFTGAFGSNDAIVFASSLANATITLTQGTLGAINATITGSGQTIDAGGASRILDLPYAGTVNLSNLTLTNAHDTNGGAIRMGPGVALTLTNCNISNSSATTKGGAIYSNGGNLTLTDTTVSGNSATQNGGGLYAKSGTVTLMNSTISNNSASSQAGGIMVNNANALIVDHSIVSGNSGHRAGGLYLAGQSQTTITASTLSGNTGSCETDSFCGGGIYANDSSFSAIDSTFAGNSTTGQHDYQAGAAYLYNSTGTFANSTITGNAAHGNNYLVGGLWELHNVTQTSRSMTLTNCTIAQNTATSYLASPLSVGGGVEAGLTGGSANYAGTLTSNNSIVSANLPADSDVIVGAGSTALSTSYNLFGTAENTATFNDPANHNVFSDTPGLGTLANNGGATQTMALLASSPALRAGGAALALYNSVPLYYDQRGLDYVRTFSGTVDIGAYEDQGERIFASEFETEP